MTDEQWETIASEIPPSPGGGRERVVDQETPVEPGARLATMHRVKGIEFDYVVVASACENFAPLKSAADDQENETDRRLFEKKERSLLYVALTRARKGVFITGYGAASPFLRDVE